MSSELTWLGHGSWSIKSAGHTILLDPFLDDSPVAPVKSDAVDADFILVSHGHYDHVADVEKVARRTGATIISNFEICEWYGAKGLENVHAMNLGGGFDFPFGRVKMTIAHHTSMLPDGANGGNPAGFVVTLPEGNVYFACDTGLFFDMKLIGTCGLALAALPHWRQLHDGPRRCPRSRKTAATETRRSCSQQDLARDRPGRRGLGRTGTQGNVDGAARDRTGGRPCRSEPAKGRRTKRIYQLDPQNVGWMVGESAKRIGEARIAGSAESLCALTDHLAPFSTPRTVIHRHGDRKETKA